MFQKAFATNSVILLALAIILAGVGGYLAFGWKAQVPQSTEKMSQLSDEQTLALVQNSVINDFKVTTKLECLVFTASKDIGFTTYTIVRKSTPMCGDDSSIPAIPSVKIDRATGATFFKALDGEFVPLNSVGINPSDVANWKTYTNSKYGFEIKYLTPFSNIGQSAPNSELGTASNPVDGVYFGPLVFVVLRDQNSRIEAEDYFQNVYDHGLNSSPPIQEQINNPYVQIRSVSFHGGNYAFVKGKEYDVFIDGSSGGFDKMGYDYFGKLVNEERKGILSTFKFISPVTSQFNVLLPNQNDIFYEDVGKINVSWSPYSGNFDLYSVSFGNFEVGDMTPRTEIIQLVSSSLTEFSEKAIDLVKLGGKSPENVKNSYYVRVQVMKGTNILEKSDNVFFTIAPVNK